MKAIIWTKYGPPEVLQLKEVDKPIPKDNEVLIKIHAAAVTAGDCEIRNLQFSLILRFLMRIVIGFKKPKKVPIPGMALAGEIEAVGKDITLFNKGDHVYGTPGFKMGSYAEYLCLPEKTKELGIVLAIKPTNMTFEEAAVFPIGGLDSFHILKTEIIQKGQTILINGAGGSIGTIAVQLAKYYGAEVTGVDSTRKLDMLSSIGANHVIDYTQEDFTKSSEKYDIIFDLIRKSSYSGCIRSLNKKGVYLMANHPFSRRIRGLLTSMVSSKKVKGGTAVYKNEDLNALTELIEAGKLKSVIERSYTLEEIVEAQTFVETGEKIGNVVISID